ncbi:PLP-dependent aminotransferase family protein [Saccharospirillum mangrovi]|uniref:MocR-like pyridoxine biosynthesis transcription factor PdxR n=1 Tax=Saccharospirillum mangrovi TaxID=2161747 RepID=UPI000D346D3C|nr:PLP-dependent aminotransferase family protein [Saccharospirillum mangrovi]
MTTSLPLTDLHLLDPAYSGQPLQAQLYLALSQRILDGRLQPGDRLPSSRLLASDLSIARNTVLAVYDQLQAEGFIRHQPRSGTFVDLRPPPKPLSPTPTATKRQSARPPPPTLNRPASQRDTDEANRPFTPGLPDSDAFPLAIWNRLQHQQENRRSLLNYDSYQGYAPLRQAIADYLRQSRGVRCQAEQVIVTQGAQQALSLIGELFLHPGDRVLIENPGYRGARFALSKPGVTLQAVPLADTVLDLNQLPAQTDAKLLYCTPTHQYPLGGILDISQRLQLLDWAARTGTWIIEDDYDSEFHFINKPIAAIQGLVDNAPVLYVGSFSKTLFPALRLGYLVVPPDLVDAFTQLKRIHAGESPLLTQAVTAAFIEQGHFARHLRRMRQHYHGKWQQLNEQIEQRLSGQFRAVAESAGMHLVLERNGDDRAWANAMQQAGFGPLALSEYALETPQRTGLVIGFANASEVEIRQGVAAVAALP